MSALLVIGLDGGTAEWIERWAAEGYLPNIVRIMQTGLHARLGGPELVVEHGTWAALLSGISRAESGYYYFRQLEPGSYALRTVSATDFDAPPFWSTLRGGSQRALLLDPPEAALIPDLPGLQVLNWDAYTPQDPTAYPLLVSDAQVRREILQKFGAPLRSPDRHNATPAQNQAILSELLAAVAKKGALARWLLARAPYGLAFIAFPETHTAGHQFFGAGGDLEHAARAVYAAVDAEIGRMLAALPADTNVALIAPIGIHDSHPNAGLAEALLRALGYQAAPPARQAAAPGLIGLARRVLPAGLRAALSRRLHSRVQREAILSAQFASATDWPRTRAFAIPSSYTSMIRVNLRGREPQGMVAPGAEYEALLNAIEADLRALVEDASGLPAVTRIQRAVDLFPTHSPGLLPDLLVDWRPGGFMEAVTHPRAHMRQARPEFFRRTDHAAPGFFAACGPGVRQPGRLPQVDALAIAPSLLALLGLPPTGRMSAAPLECLQP